MSAKPKWPEDFTPCYDQRALDNAVEAERVQCALIAKQHIGSAAARRRARGQLYKTMSHEVSIEVEAEERGEDIASGLIEKAILARSNP